MNDNNSNNSLPDIDEIDDQALTMGIIAHMETKLAAINEKIAELKEKDRREGERWEAGENARHAKWVKDNDARAMAWREQYPSGNRIWGPQPPDATPYPERDRKVREEIEKLQLEKRELDNEINVLKKSIAELPEKYTPFNSMNNNQQEKLLFTSLKEKPTWKQKTNYIFWLDDDLAVVALTGPGEDEWATFKLLTTHQAKEKKKELIGTGQPVIEVWQTDRRLMGFDVKNDTPK